MLMTQKIRLKRNLIRLSKKCMVEKVWFSLFAKREMANLERLGFGTYPICVAKTQYSFSDNPKSLGAPEDFEINIKQLKVSAGKFGFIVALAGDMMTMPGLPKSPAQSGLILTAMERLQVCFNISR